jgi:hypothetical protein
MTTTPVLVTVNKSWTAEPIEEPYEDIDFWKRGNRDYLWLGAVTAL